jgi:hypothetical protein
MARTRDELAEAVCVKLKECFNAYLTEDDDTGLDGWFQPDEKRGARMTTKKIVEFDGYTMGSKDDLIGDNPYEALSQEMKDNIPDNQTALFLVVGKTEESDEWVFTHWLVESARFAQKASCDWWDACEGEVIDEWGIEYDDLQTEHGSGRND